MRIEELRRAREELTASLEELSEASGIGAEQLRTWERRSRIPLLATSKIELGLWELRRTRALETAGIPPCPWVEAFDGWKNRSRVEELARHLDTCEICRRRSTVLESQVGPPPVSGGLLQRVLAFDQHLSGWSRSAYRGSLIVLAMGGIGAAAMLGKGLVRQDPAAALMGVASLVLMAGSGAIGGLAHHWTREWRTQGAMGHYGSAVATMYAYLLAAFGMTVLAVWMAGVEFDLSTVDATAIRAYLASFVIVGILFGVLFGRVTRHKPG